MEQASILGSGVGPHDVVAAMWADMSLWQDLMVLWEVERGVQRVMGSISDSESLASCSGPEGRRGGVRSLCSRAAIKRCLVFSFVLVAGGMPGLDRTSWGVLDLAALDC